MANVARMPYSNTASNTPSSLDSGQLGINQADGKLYYRNSSGVVTQYGAALFAALSHSHAASDITSGTLDIARIPTGSSSTSVCIGNDSRLSDTRTPTDNTVSTAKIVDGAVTLVKTTGIQKAITSGTAAPSGGSDGDIYLQYS